MRCEGWRRTGGAFSLGPPTWSQCDNNATVMLDIEQEDRQQMPACNMCWSEAKEVGLKIHNADPLAN